MSLPADTVPGPPVEAGPPDGIRSLMEPLHGAWARGPPAPAGPRPQDGGTVGRGGFPQPGARLPPNSTPPDGPAMLLVKRADGRSFEGANPFAIRRWISGICGDVASARPIKSGSILIETQSTGQTTRLLSAKDMAGVPIRVELADRLNTTEGLIFCPELCSLTEEYILQELAVQGVTEVTRLRSRDHSKPNPLIRLRFRGLLLPHRVCCGYMSVQVRPWIPPPRQCRKCWMYGHGDKTCRNKKVWCGRCAGHHDTDECQSSQLHCTQCGEGHESWNRDCGMRKQAMESQRARLSPQRLPERIDTGVVFWPPLTPLKGPVVVCPPLETPSAQHEPTESQTEPPSQPGAQPPSQSGAQPSSQSQSQPQSQSQSLLESQHETQPPLPEPSELSEPTLPSQTSQDTPCEHDHAYASQDEDPSPSPTLIPNSQPLAPSSLSESIVCTRSSVRRALDGTS